MILPWPSSVSACTAGIPLKRAKSSVDSSTTRGRPWLVTTTGPWAVRSCHGPQLRVSSAAGAEIIFLP
jgi:hypothetical protein